MDFQLAAVKIFRRLRRAGLAATLREGMGWLDRLRRGSKPDEFDLKHGTDTGGQVPLWKLRISSANARFGAAYQTVDEQALVDAIGVLNADPRSFTFIDLGCGKGRALLIAAKLGFTQIVGVEFASELAAIAKKNLATMEVANAVVVEGDAAQYHFPTCNLVVYLFNPFSLEVMEKVVANMGNATRNKLYVIYAAPRCAALFDSCTFLTPIGCPPGREDIRIWSAVADKAKN
jgi:SAM-dependent methyltransferase